MQRFRACWALGLCWLLLTPALAQQGLLPQRDDHGVPYVTGGVGDEERDALRSMAADYTLRLLFAQPTGQFLGEVGVVIHDQDGRLAFSATSDGPYLYVRLPAGTWQVTASTGGHSQNRTVTLGSTAVDLRLIFVAP